MRDIAAEAKEEGNKIVVVWDRNLLPKNCIDSIDFAEEFTKNGTEITTIVAIWYWGQEEIARAVKALIENWVSLEEVTKERISDFLETAKYPPPDLIVRTGWHVRHSGFLLFQSPYAEYYFSEKNWPDFDEEELDRAIKNFSESERKFGK